jgi:hypothetical protein
VPHIEFLILDRPLSLQTNSRRKFQAWKDTVRGEIAKVWGGRRILSVGEYHLTIVHMYTESPPDVDNIIKPIQDALEGLVLFNDRLVSDVESHRRHLRGHFDFDRLPPLIMSALTSSMECVYVRLDDAIDLEDLL